MTDWFQTFDDGLWLRPNEGGEEEAVFIKRALRLRKGQSVLDAPCGAGRIAVHLARAGCVVTCVDLRDKFIKQARARFRKEGVKGAFKVMDLRGLDFANEFHGIYNWFGSFGYFSEKKNFDLLQRYARALRRGGRLLIDQINREFVLRHLRTRQTIDGVTISSRWDERTQRINGRWVIQRGHRKKSCRSSIRLYTPGQMRGLFDHAGLEIEAVYGSFTGGEYRRGAPRMVMVGRK